jgi:hypothetical protein
MKTTTYWPAIVSTSLIAALLFAAALPADANDSKKHRNKAHKQMGQDQSQTPNPAQWNKTAGDAQGRYSVGYDATKAPAPKPSATPRVVYHGGQSSSSTSAFDNRYTGGSQKPSSTPKPVTSGQHKKNKNKHHHHHDGDGHHDND